MSTADVPTGRALALASRAGRVALAWSERDVRGTVGRLMIADGAVSAPLNRARPLTLRRGRIHELALALGERGSAARRLAADVLARRRPRDGRYAPRRLDALRR